MPSPQRNERREFRYPLHLPVVVRMEKRKEMRAQSENISLGGILLSSTVLIPEGSAVELSVGVEHLPDPGVLLRARGKVLRVQPKDTGDFTVAIQLEGAFKLPLAEPSPSSLQSNEPSVPEPQNAAAAAASGTGSVRGWHTET